jgi:small subunit ribosomal protein S2
VVLSREIVKLQDRLGGIRDMTKLPDLVYIVDVRREETAVHESNILSIPVIALVDTNCDPGGVDYVIPANDDAIRAIKLLSAKIADAVLEGKAMRKDVAAPEDAGESYGERKEKEEDLLGPATLAKMQSGELSFEDEAAAANAGEIGAAATETPAAAGAASEE